MVDFGVEDADADEDEDEDEDADGDADADEDEDGGGGDADGGCRGADGVSSISCWLIGATIDVAAAAAANVWASGWLITVYCDFFASSFTPINLNREEETTEPINHTKHIVIMRIHDNMTSTALFTRWQNDSRTRRDGESLIA